MCSKDIYIYIYISVCVGLGLTLWQLRLMFGQEKMGFKVEEKGPGPSTPDAFYAIAGCKTPTNPNDRGCREQTTTYAPHMQLKISRTTFRWKAQLYGSTLTHSYKIYPFPARLDSSQRRI